MTMKRWRMSKPKKARGKKVKAEELEMEATKPAKTKGKKGNPAKVDVNGDKPKTNGTASTQRRSSRRAV